MKYYRLLKNKNESIYLIDNYLDESLETGLVYLEKGLTEKESLLDENNNHIVDIRLSPNLLEQLKTVSVEINKEFNINIER